MGDNVHKMPQLAVSEGVTKDVWTGVAEAEPITLVTMGYTANRRIDILLIMDLSWYQSCEAGTEV